MKSQRRFDFVIIGSGMGGSTMAYALKESGASILILERGGFIPQEPENWDPQAVTRRGRYDASETWYDERGRPFHPRLYYNVGGSTKVYGAAMLRLREQDFLGVEHEEGQSVPWPITYAELRPYYERSEALLGVRGATGEDPTEPPRDPFPAPAVPFEPLIADLAERLAAQGLRPFHLPVSVDQGPGGSCILCPTCDGFPCKLHAKGEAETRLLGPALSNDNVTLWTNALVTRLNATQDGKHVRSATVIHKGAQIEVSGDTFVLSAGAINSAALLLHSRDDRFPDGLANSSGMVGRNYMAHNNTVLMAVAPWRRNPTRFQKSLAVNDFYLSGSTSGKPLGNIQMRGKILPQHLKKKEGFFMRTFARFLAEHSVDLWLMSEDLPDPENRVTVDEKRNIRLRWRPNNVEAHRQLVEKAKQMMRKAGYPLLLTERRGLSAIQHQCGTLRFGDDPRTVVLDPWCRSYDLPNLYVVDTSHYPSSGAVNPSLTLVAQGLRVADHILGNIA